MQKTIYNKYLGEIECRYNPRARRIIFRFKDGRFQATMPVKTGEQQLDAVIAENLGKLLKLKEEKKAATFRSGETIFSSDHMTITLLPHDIPEWHLSGRDGKYVIRHPQEEDLSDKATAEHIKKLMAVCMKHRAKTVMPARTGQLARQFGFIYKEVKITSARRSWGSCTGKQNINFSFYTMSLPAHLTDYVILHELCHTVEMNHSARFWGLLDRCTGGRAFALRDEMKRYSTGI